MLTPLQRRIVDISYKRRSSHLSSCLTAVGIIDQIYSERRETDPFILSCGHAFLALAVVLESRYGFNAEALVEKHGTHPTRDDGDKVWFTTGSLACGITAACGFALADRARNVHVLISDGECGEPDVFSALAFARKNRLDNLKVHVNVNGYTAYDKVDVPYLISRLHTTWPSVNIHLTSNDAFPGLSGLKGHYKVLTEEEYLQYAL